MTEFYVGLAALQAGLLAIVIAAVLVLIQMASQSFSLVTPALLLRRPLVILTAVGGAAVMAFALVAAIRTAYPAFDAVPGDQGSDLFLESVWPAVGGAAGVLLILVMSGVLLYRLVSDLQGPGLARMVAASLNVERWSDWLDFVDPDADATPELRKRYEVGQVTDPLAPLFEMAIVSVQSGRYAIVDPVLAEVRTAIDHWFVLPKGDRPDTGRSATRLIGHFNDVLDAAVSSQAVAPMEAVVRNVEQLAVNAVGRGHRDFAVRITDELAHWVGRLHGAGHPGPSAECVRAIRRVATQADQDADMSTFEQCALALGLAGQELAATHERQPERLLRADYGDVRHGEPIPALSNALDSLTTQFTDYDRGIKGELHNAKFVLDGLRVAGSALLKAPEADSETGEAAAGVISCMGHIGIAAAKTSTTKVFELVIYNFETLARDCEGADTRVMESFAYSSFELGLNAQTYSADHAERLAELCRMAGEAPTKSAVASLYRRGDTMYVPDDVQDEFVRCLESVLGTLLEDRAGISPSES